MFIASFRLRARIGTMNQIGAGVFSLSSSGGEGRGRGGPFRLWFMERLLNFTVLRGRSQTASE
jgi:hypothetical protein